MDSLSIPWGQRAAFALVVAFAAGLVAWHAQTGLHAAGGDHLTLWRAARDVAQGIDPYHIGADGSLPGVNDLFPYPLPAVLLSLPFAWFSASSAAIAFTVCSAGLLAFAITRDGFARAPMFISVSFLAASQLSQSSMAVMSAALVPGLGALLVAKPNLGLSLFAWRPSLKLGMACAALLLVSWLAFPSWPAHWLAFLHRSPAHHAPMMVGLGSAGLLAAFRWRRPEARLLLAMTLIPHGLYFYDELPLWLIARTSRESRMLAAASWIAWFGWVATTNVSMPEIAPWLVSCCYPIAALMVLSRPNEAT